MATPVLRERVVELIGRGAQLVEVLGAKDYETLHIDGAVNIPLDEFGTPGALDRLDRNRPVVTYCFDSRCDLSSRAAHRLEQLGFAEVYDYVASKVDWFASSLPYDGTAADLPRVADLAVRDVPTCRVDEAVGEVRDRVGEWDVCAVVDEANVVVGIVRAEAFGLEPGRRVEDVMQEGPSTYRPDVTVEEMARTLQKNPEPRILVTNADGTLVGIAAPDEVERLAKASS